MSRNTIIGPISMAQSSRTVMLVFAHANEARDFFNSHTIKRVVFSVEMSANGTHDVKLNGLVVSSGYDDRTEALAMARALAEACQ